MPLSAARGEDVEEAAEADAPANRSGRPRICAPRRRSRAARPSRPSSGLSADDLEAARQRFGVERAGAALGFERAGLDHALAGDREAFRAAEGLAAVRIGIAPARPGAGVEQHREDGEVEGGAGALGRAALRQCRGSGDEVPPAGMEGNVEVGKCSRVTVGDEIGGGVEAVEIDRPAFDLPASARSSISCARSRTAAALSRSLQGFVALPASGQKLPRSRPTVFLSSSALGGPSGVK